MWYVCDLSHNYRSPLLFFGAWNGLMFHCEQDLNWSPNRSLHDDEELSNRAMFKLVIIFNTNSPSSIHLLSTIWYRLLGPERPYAVEEPWPEVRAVPQRVQGHRRDTPPGPQRRELQAHTQVEATFLILLCQSQFCTEEISCSFSDSRWDRTAELGPAGTIFLLCLPY